MRLERFKIQKFSNPGKGDTPFPGPYPPPHPRPRPFGPRRILAPPWQKASCAYALHLFLIRALAERNFKQQIQTVL